MLRIETTIICLFSILNLTKCLFQATNLNAAVSNNYTLVDNVTYDLNFSLSSQSIAGGSYLTVQLSQRFLITASTLNNCKYSTNSASSLSGTTTCTVIYYPASMVYQITMTGLFPSTAVLSFLRINFMISNPYAQNSQSINITIYSSGSVKLGSGTAYISTYLASVMTGCSFVSNSNITAANSTQTITLIPPQRLLVNSYLVIPLPIWSPNITTNQATASLICTRIQGTDSPNLNCNIGSPIGATQTLNITSGLISSNRTASTIQFTINALRNPWSLQPFGPISYQLMYGTYLTQVCYNVYSSVTTPSTLGSFSITVTNLNISTVNTGVRVIFTPSNPFPRPSNQIILQYPSSLTVAYSGTLTASSNSIQMTISGLTSTSVSGFTVTTPPSTRQVIVTLTTYQVDAGVPYATQTRTFTIQSVAGTITATSVLATNPQVNAITTYTIQYTIKNKLILGSFINIVFPTQINIQTGTATCSMSGHTCNIISNKNISISILSTINTNTALTVTITDVKNANQALITSSFAIYTYYDAGYDSLVDSIATGITLQMQAKLLSIGTISPINYTNYATTSYQINLTLLDPIPTGGYIVIIFPTTVVPQAGQLVAASFGIGTCNPNMVNSTYITVTGCFTADMNNLAFSITLGNILNPPSFKPTTTFKVYTYGPSNTMVNYLDTGLTVTMNISANTVGFAVSPNVFTVGATTTYYFQITHAISAHTVNDYAIITFPSLMSVPSTPSCSATAGITTINCVSPSSTQLTVTYATAPSTTIQFSVLSIINYLVGDQSINYALKIYDSSGFLMQQYLASPVIYSQSTITTTSINNDNNIALNQLSNITLTITNSIILYPTLSINLTQLDIIIPTGFTIGSSCTTTSGTCSMFSATKYRIVNVGLSISNLVVTMPRILLNSYSPISPSFQLIYTYNGYNVSVKSNGVTVGIFCTSPCQRCSTTVTTCQSCLPAPNLMILHDNVTKTCATTCVAGKYADASNQCVPCVSPCVNCLDALNCTSCITGRWLYQPTSRCMSICPSTYYNSSNGLCTSCVNPCGNCTTATSCLDCSTGYFTNNWCVNASSCPAGTYANTTTMICQPCQSPCSSCSQAQTNCTSCQNGYLYYSNLCVISCPSGMYQSTIYCYSCTGLCATCTSATVCTSCTSNFLNPTTGACVTNTSCPTGTYANTTTLRCQNCQPPCQACTLSQTTCTTCISGYLYYNNICTTNCPAGMYQSSTFCFNCVGSCQTCTNATFCTSCTSNYLDPITGTCVTSTNCPAGTYANATTNRCENCPAGCTSCTNSTNCTTCNSAIYFFYNYGCYSSCPSGTYQSGITCATCTPPCLTCRGNDLNCTSCIAPQLYYNNGCYGTCPTGSYNNNGTCLNCLVTCQSCSSGTSCDTCTGSLYYQSGQCVSQCSAGSFGTSVNNTCISCSPPCSSCLNTATNCTACISPQVQFQNVCYGSCPNSYFAVAGSCKTCPNCANCIAATTCQQCLSGYYLFNGICYTSCPSTAPIIDVGTSTCGSCDLSCLTCQNTAKNCTSCYSNTYLYKGSCLTSCPQGFIQDPISGTCKQPLIGSIIYFPFSFTFIFFFIVCIASKFFNSQTQNITTLGAISSICQFASWCVLAFIITVDYSLQDSLIPIIQYVSLACIVLSIGVGFAFVIAINKQYECDKGLLAWKEFQNSHLYSYRVINGLSCLSFRFFRFLYSRFFNRTFFSMYIADGQRFLTTTNRLTFACLITNSLPMIAICAFVLYKKQIYDQTFFCSLDTIFLGFMSAVFLTIDSCKNKDHFQSIKDGLPFLKYKNMTNDESIIGQALLSRPGQQRDPAKSQCDEKQRDKIFKKITWLPNLNKFGHLNVIENTPDDKDEIKSLPQYNKLADYQQYDPYHIHSQLEMDRVVDDDLYFMEQRKRKQEQEQQRRRKQQQQKQKQRLRLLRQQQQQQQRKRKQAQRRKKQLMQQDQRERVELQFPDLAAIDKVQNKNGKNRKNPLDLLSNCKKTDEKPIDDKALKKLQQIGKKNGIDPNFMKQTFGVQKNHNPQLLNQIIDKHNHVKRQSIKQLFNEQNNPQILQQLFSKNSKMDPKKLREILNDPDSANLIKKLADKQHGIVSAQICKQLFQQNSKYTKQFTKNLLSQDNGMDPQKLKTLLKDSNAKGKDSPLKALKKIGGQNLQNTNLLNNMMGSDSVLNPQDFTRVANDLSLKAIQNLFANKSKNSDIITSKILNNKKINLKNLTPILQDEQLLHQLAEALGSDDPYLQQNLINLFKNADNIDPAKLKQMLADPIIRQKLLSKPVDPSFLQALLSKDSKSDLKILSNALKQMSDQAIRQTFKFDPEKNTDFKNLAELFDKNPKTDPVLVSKMLQPDMVKKLYVKGNDTKMLNKLVQKGNQFDPQVIKNVYGDQRNNIFDTKTDNMFGGMNQMNLANFDEDKGQQYRSQKQYSLGFQKNIKNNQINMSRTAGGVLSFLTPIVPINNNLKNNNMNSKSRKGGFNQTNQDGWTSQGDNDEELDQDQQIGQQQELQQNGKGRRKRKGKKTKKKLMDIRHPAQQIYLQRIEAPHQHAIRKASIRKKKKKIQNPGVMDEDNDIFDMDF